MERYEPKKIEEKWQKHWNSHPEINAAQADSPKEKKYVLDMWPYPSGEGLHVGHVESYTATDIMSRYFRMKGFNVMHPQGWDAFGLPAENFAIKTGVHPSVTTAKAIATFRSQMDKMGFSYDWSREQNSSTPEYYKWTQWLFLLFYKHGLAYKKKAKVNWCDACQTVLANEQVVNGECERCGGKVIQKDLEQWFFKITDFIEDNKKTAGLLSGLEKVDWPESIKASQKNWIGRSEGTTVKFEIKISNSDGISKSQIPISKQIKNSNNQNSKQYIDVFTTRVDTIFGCTYCVVAPEHEIISQLKGKIKNYSAVEKYIMQARTKTELERTELQKDKTGVKLEGVAVVNPFTKQAVPLFVADYVLGQYGTGAVMAVPAHDERDFVFAKKYDLTIKQSIAPLNLETGKDAPKEGKQLVRRKATVAIVKHWEKDEFLCLDWEKFDWKSFVIGGIEDGETGEAAAIREAKEETGYQDIKSIRKINGEIHSCFYAAHKDVNRYGEFECYYIELGSGEYVEPKEEDVKNHKSQWVGKKDVAAFINLNNHSQFWDILINGEKAFTEDGVVIDSGEFTDLKSAEAREKMTAWLEKEKLGEKKINYRLRDWLVSRQRYWGAPIPIVYCDKCGEVPVPEKDLPVVLPTDVDFKPTGESPLVHSKTFHDVKCPKCGGKARRESDTMDTFVCSSWYYLRYADPQNEQVFASEEALKKWLPVDLYVGGAEHAVLHLLYSRFFTKVLHSLGYVGFDEPFLKLRNQGLIIAEDGRKMSKSLGNVVNPDQVVEQVGADSLRLFEMFMGPLEATKPWNTKGIAGVQRFLEKVWKLQAATDNQAEANQKIQTLLHKTIKKVTEDIENFRFNTAISQMMILVNAMEKEKNIVAADYSGLVVLLAPFAPHLAEELWNKLGNKKSVFLEKWPEHDPQLLAGEEIEMAVQVNGKLRDRIYVAPDVTEDEAKETALESVKVKTFTQGKEIKKIIFVPGKLINIVVGQ